MLPFRQKVGRGVYSSSVKGFSMHCYIKISLPKMLPRKTCHALFHSSRVSKTAETSEIKARLPVAVYPKRTHNCGELRSNHVGQRVVVCGWAQKLRKLSSDFLFLPIRDSYGLTQLVFTRSNNLPIKNQLLEKILELSTESVICVEGVVLKRSQETINNECLNNYQIQHAMATGEIEIEIEQIICLNNAKPLPFHPSDKILACHFLQRANDITRYTNRWVDLRRDFLQSNLRLRSKVSWIIRDFFNKEGFVEVETPILFKSTPEGAREFIVPTRSKGFFYALSQSPQQYKQLLMVGGIDKYYQIAKCFRDEDLRANRQSEFTQIDIEMSFVSAKDIISLTEKLITLIWRESLGLELESRRPFPQMTYKEAMCRFGSDKPDIRYEMEISDITQYVSDIVETSDETIECLLIKKGGLFTSKEIKNLASLQGDQFSNKQNIKRALDIFKITEENSNSWISKSILIGHSGHAAFVQDTLTHELNIQVGDLIVLNKRDSFLSGGSTTMGKIRKQAVSLLLSKDLNTGRLTSTHHPFTSPVEEDVRAQHYDLILDGEEIGGGSIRVHFPDLQRYILEHVLGIRDIEGAGFGHLIRALGSGCPPHGGIALGFDRLIALMVGTDSIRDVIAFPKALSGRDLCVGSPSPVAEERIISEYGIRLS
ncbi:hypothetical protein G9A89_004179 [Geosiphon pyriformis]|nr:hypothetical protein G9A89_004179 [Geosiphon pyriformis]